jgi:release factor glutamine methyltransferase
VGAGDRGDGDRERAWTVLAALTWTSERFAQAGVASARLDAELLLCAAIGLDRVGLYCAYDRPLDAAERERYRGLVRRRLAGEPVAYLLGKQEFWSLELSVDARVLIPRRESEHVVEAMLRELAGRPAGAPAPRLCDVCTGSGAIALALAKERPDAQVVACDASADALVVARANAERLGLAVDFVAGDLLAPAGVRAPFDGITANPPYVAAGELARLSREVKHEPQLALDGGADGLHVYRRLVPDALALLAPGAALVTEIGQAQAAAVSELCEAAGGYEAPEVIRDLAGLDRVIVARKR